MADNQKYSLKAVLGCVDNLSPTLKKVQKNLKSVDRSFKNVVDSTAALATKLMVPITALAGAGVFSLSKAVDNFTSLGDSIDKASQRAGIGVGALQKFRLAAELGGASVEQMDDALAKLNLKMGEALTGKSEDAANLFKTLGIALKDSSGKVRNSAEVMRDLAEAIKVNADQTDRMLILNTLLGDNLAKMLIPVLSGGAEALDEVSAKAEKLGIVMSEADSKAAAELTDAMTLFNKVTLSLQSTIASKLSPVLIDLIENFQSIIIENKELLATNIEKFVRDLSEGIKSIKWDEVIKCTFEFFKTLSNVIDAIGGFKTILYAVGAVIGASFVSNLVSITTALIGMSKAVYALMGPWGIAIGLVTTYLAYFDEINSACYEAGKAVREFIGGAFDWVMKKISPVIDLLQGFFGFGGSIDAKVTAQGQAVLPQTPLLGEGMNGQITVRVEATDGSRARVEDMRSTGGELRAETTGSYSYLND